MDGEVQLTDIGPFNFSNLQILSSGYFVLKVESENLLEAETEEFYIENQVVYVELTGDRENVVIFEQFEIKVTLFGEDFNRYLGSREVSLYSDPEVVILEDSLSYSNNESLTFMAFALRPGNFIFNATVNETSQDYSTQEFTIKVSKANIKLEIDSIVNFT